MSEVIDAFTEHLVAGSSHGDHTARTSLERVQSLSGSKREALEKYLLEGDRHRLAELAVKNPEGPHVDGGLMLAHGVHTETIVNPEEEEDTPDGEASASAASRVRHIHSYAWQEFLFLGISITKTTISADYLVANKKVTKVLNYGGKVDHNYDPTATVTVSKHGDVLHNGIATFKTRVDVKRGPIPYLGVHWSHRTSYQFLKVGGSGIISHGWAAR